MSKQGWIGVDLDGTLARYDGWQDGKIGQPVPLMASRVKRWLEEGREVRIFTARVAALYLPMATPDARAGAASERDRINAWTKEHFGQVLQVTAIKDFTMVSLYDDRCIQVEPNTGRCIGTAD